MRGEKFFQPPKKRVTQYRPRLKTTKNGLPKGKQKEKLRHCEVVLSLGLGKPPRSLETQQRKQTGGEKGADDNGHGTVLGLAQG